MNLGANISYSFEIKPYDVIEITIQHKTTVCGKDIYQSIIVRIERTRWQPAHVPMISVTPAQVSQAKGKVILFCIL